MELSPIIPPLLSIFFFFSLQVDAFGEDVTFDLGAEHKVKLESRLRMLEEGNLRRLSGTGKVKAKFEKYHAQSQVQTYEVAHDNTLPVAGGSKKRKLIEEVEEESAEVTSTPKQKTKKLKKEEEEVVEEAEAGPTSEKKKKKKKNKAEETMELDESAVAAEEAVEEPKSEKKKKKKKKQAEE